MHHLMLVTLDMPVGATSLEARQRAYSLLLDDNSFCGDGGRFGTPLCDWFVIGGRWSGLLAEKLLGQDYTTAFQAEFPELAKGGYRLDLIEKHRDDLKRLWQRFGGSEYHPAARSTHQELGYCDDARLIDQVSYDSFLKPFSGSDADDGFADLDIEPVAESFIGRKWLVVIDYHN